MRSTASPTSKRLTTALSHENKFLANDVLPCEATESGDAERALNARSWEGRRPEPAVPALTSSSC